MSGDGSGSVRVPVPRSGGGYEVEVASGAFPELGRRCRERLPEVHRYAVIADGRVADLYGRQAADSLRAAGREAALFSFPAGEASKSREEWRRLTDRLLEEGYGRDSAVVAVGGGVTGDLAGFVAATFMRGVPVVQVPTTLLAMVDASVGGKTGVNTPAGKNLVGAFHHPTHVLADPELLGTLPRRELAAGLAEAVKAAAVADGELLGRVEESAARLREGDPATLEPLIRRAVEIKAEVVGADPEESGRRAVLNFGHTLGHALEATGGYGGLHGEAVAAGMRLEAGWGEHEGVTASGTARRLERVLRACGVQEWPVREADPRRLVEAAGSDKKARRGRLRLVLLRAPGEVARDPDGRWTLAADEERLRAWLGESVSSSVREAD